MVEENKKLITDKTIYKNGEEDGGKSRKGLQIF